MTKRWGLDLDMSAVRLMRLDDGTWVEEAIEKIDSPDIEDRLQKMLSVIEDGAPVELFLPRDQILYTDVTLGDGDPKPQIEKALDGLTPYSLDELSFDWETTAPGTARVAAIALDTLDEAAAFAEVRNIDIGGYSSLADAEDFPRQPAFDGPSITPEPEAEARTEAPTDEAAGTTPAFASARKPSRPPGTEVEAAAAAIRSRITPTAPPAKEPPAEVAKTSETSKPAPVSDSKPVVEVDDPTPVMSVKPPNLPLDPGIPIAAPNAPPRIRTDIAAASVSGPVASLTPPASIKLHNRGTPQIGVAVVFLVAFLITIGVAVLVWNLLPMRPGSTTVMPPAAESPNDGIADGDTAAADVTETGTAPPAVEVSEETAAVEAPPDQPGVAAAEPEPELEPEPAPALLAEVPGLTAPETGVAPDIAALAPTVATRTRPASLFRALRDGSRLPGYDPSVPDAPPPSQLASILTAAPFPGPDPDIEQQIDDIYFASIEPASLAFDAVALPDPRRLRPDPVPRADSAAPEVTAVDPGAVAAALDDALTGPGGLIQTELAASLPDTKPVRRPGNVLEEIERRQLGGLTRGELGERRPNPRPASAQTQALAAAEASDASDLAVATSLDPRRRPDGFSEIVAEARALIAADRVTASADFDAPDTSAAVTAALEADAEPELRPLANQRLNIPTSASVARQATIEDAIQLNRVNLVGVYGTPNDRRALVRLSNGRYVKVKVGDRVDGGTVAQITDSTLQYRKGNRVVSLEIPKG